MKIKITQEDIVQGTKTSPCNCPIALACIKHFITTGVYVSKSRVEIWRSETSNGIYKLDKIGRKFIKDFDLDLTVSPCEVELTL